MPDNATCRLVLRSNSGNGICAKAYAWFKKFYIIFLLLRRYGAWFGNIGRHKNEPPPSAALTYCFSCGFACLRGISKFHIFRQGSSHNDRIIACNVPDFQYRFWRAETVDNRLQNIYALFKHHEKQLSNLSVPVIAYIIFIACFQYLYQLPVVLPDQFWEIFFASRKYSLGNSGATPYSAPLILIITPETALETNL